jgi:putative endonuclease
MPGRRSRDALGIAGERHARMMLEAHGYRFLTSNWHCSAGELDLVMLENDLLVFVEVKTRRGERADRADNAVSPAKASRILAAAEWYVAEHLEHQDRTWRCDLLAITIDPETGAAHANHYQNCIVTG